MCVIINKPRDIRISRDTLRKCWKANPHGAGFMYVESGNLNIFKGLMTFEDFYNEFKKVNEDRHVVIHFRLASYGAIVPEQTHPMLINPNLAFVHNGHMLNQFIKEATNKGLSDTMVFNQKILQKLPTNFLDTPVLTELITGYIDCSVMLFLDSDDKVTILGDQHDSCVFKGSWFSNEFWDDSYETEAPSLDDRIYDFKDDLFDNRGHNSYMASQDDD